ncbi:uncharacterized protein LOC106657794 [Trichogramma pretiosum]|uniref:uncharacterized protein LOC106657792 n=1 Tax=Trichogramma pretiosum TaxID=7493 RepID=UPI0006C9D86D|nr:uncharacterized protein LOC106657792 [Trichogramma pretiosum]XP_014234956.1 uncharacterized protein LOC106657794 [Trichogramma pretiosum]
MFSRSFLVFFGVLALVALTISAQPVIDDEQQENSLEIDLSELDEVESRNPALAIAVRVLAGAFRWAAKHCLKEAAQNCKQHWKHPKALVNCAKHFLQSNRGRCALG